jgi:microcystin-dependent protein
MKQILSSFAFSIVVAGGSLAAMTTSSPASACAEAGSGYIGSVCATAANFCPRGYALANGAILSISTNSALFAVLGATYGGDGRSTFALPDLRGRSPVGVGQGAGLTNVAWGQRRGSEKQLLSLAQMPAHSHTAAFIPAGGGSPADVEVSTENGTKAVPDDGDYLAVGKNGLASVNSYVPASSAGTTASLGGVTGGGGGGGTVTIGTNGGSQPFYIVPPQLGLYYCINTDGLFPPRN